MANKVELTDPEEIKAENHVVDIMGPAAPHDVEDVAKPLQEIAPEMPKEDAFAEEPIAELPVEGAVEKPVEETDAAPVEFDESAEETDESADEKVTDKAVDDIVHSDADAVLPESKAEAEDAIVMKSSLRDRLKNGWNKWWDNPWKRYGTITAAALIIGLVAFVAPIRAMVLNTVGVRSSIQLTVFDGATNLPLQNAVVQVDNKSVKTDANGAAKVTGIHLGKRDVQVSKVAFATHRAQLNLGIRIIDLGDVTLKPVGTQLTYIFTDYLSGKPIADVSLQGGEATAKSDKNGKAVITIQPSDAVDIKITAEKEGYRTDSLTAPADVKSSTGHKLVPATHVVFVSKESGKYDVYKMYLDGTDRSVLLAGTGLETQAIATLPNASGENVAIASSRDDRRNSDGYLLTALNIVNVATGDRTNIEYAEQINLIGWRGGTLVYQQTVAGASAANPNRQKIIAYDISANKRYQLAAANYFTGIQLVGGTVYYTVSATDPSSQPIFARVSLDGSGKKTLLTGSIWSLLRTGYDTMKLQTSDAWYQYTLGAAQPVVSTPVSDYTSRYYVDSPDGKTSAWVDTRDINGVLIARNLATAKEAELTTQKYLQAPLYWLSDSIVVYRVSGSNEVADYAVSIAGGQPKKLADVSLTGIRY
jgi:hypothetical protein